MSREVIEDFLVSLSELPEVDSFAGTNIYPVLGPEGVEKMIVYNPRGGLQETFYEGSFGLTTMVIQLDIYSGSFLSNQVVLDSIVSTFNGFSGTLNSRTLVQRGYVTNHSELIDALDSRLFRSTLDISLTF